MSTLSEAEPSISAGDGEDEGGEHEDVFDSEESEDGEVEDEGKITKPQGEASRPGRGGYTLDETLLNGGWTASELSKLKVCHLFFWNPLNYQLTLTIGLHP